METLREKDHTDRFDEVLNGLGIEKVIANKLMNFFHYEIMTAKRERQSELEEIRSKVKSEFENFTLMDWSGEGEVYEEIERLKKQVLSTLG